MTIRILIVDDHRVVREGLRTFLGYDPELQVVGEAVDGMEAVEKARTLRPDVVLMDLHLPGTDGITATTIICRDVPETAVLILTGIAEASSITRAIRAGASGYLLKDADAGEIQQAIKAAASGQVSLSHELSMALLREVRAVDHLTEREMSVLRMLAKGHSNKEIAQRLHIGEDTVKTHVRHILAKLEVESRTQAILVAMRLGLIEQDS